MKSFSNRLSEVFKGKKEPGINEIVTLLNFEDTPAALVDNTARLLLHLNSRMMKLVQFSTWDVSVKELEFLFPDLELTSAYSGEVRRILINRNNLPPIQVRARFDYIDPATRWIVIRVLPELGNDEDRQLVLEDTYRKLTQFSRLAEIPDLQQGIDQGVSIFRDVIGCDTVCVFQADSNQPQLKKIGGAGTSEDFPDVLPSTDLVKLDQPIMWQTGTRIQTELHRAAKVSKLEYVGSAPLNQGSGAFGLLVAAGKGQPPANMSLELLNLLATQLISMFQQQILVKNLHEKLENSQETINLRNHVFDNINEAVVVLNESLNIVEVNAAAEWLFGYTSVEAGGQPYDNILIGTDRLLPALLEAQKGKSTLNIGKANLNRRNGQAIPVEIKVIPIDGGESVKAIQLLITDISENEQSKAVTQQLEHRAVLGDYTAAFAHDVRNPINNISTGLQLLGATLNSDDSSQDMINRMLGDCTRLNHLMESFLAFSRPLELKFEPFELEPFLRRIIDRWQPRLARVNVKPVMNIEGEGIRIFGDARSLENVFTNLVSNALEAMTDSGDTLAIKAVLVDEINGRPTVEISVSDNGPGIPQDIRDHIFEPFITTRKQGTGLGLAITKQIVNAHKGSIRVDSFPGGTVFTVQLPGENGEKK